MLLRTLVVLLALLVQGSRSATTPEPAPLSTVDGTSAQDLPTSTMKTSEMMIELHEDDDKDSEKSSILSSINEENNFGNQNVKRGLIKQILK